MPETNREKELPLILQHLSLNISSNNGIKGVKKAFKPLVLERELAKTVELWGTRKSSALRDLEKLVLNTLIKT